MKNTNVITKNPIEFYKAGQVIPLEENGHYLDTEQYRTHFNGKKELVSTFLGLLEQEENLGLVDTGKGNMVITNSVTNIFIKSYRDLGAGLRTAVFGGWDMKLLLDKFWREGREVGDVSELPFDYTTSPHAINVATAMDAILAGYNDVVKYLYASRRNIPYYISGPLADNFKVRYASEYALGRGDKRIEAIANVISEAEAFRSRGFDLMLGLNIDIVNGRYRFEKSVLFTCVEDYVDYDGVYELLGKNFIYITPNDMDANIGIRMVHELFEHLVQIEPDIDSNGNEVMNKELAHFFRVMYNDVSTLSTENSLSTENFSVSVNIIAKGLYKQLGRSGVTTLPLPTIDAETYTHKTLEGWTLMIWYGWWLEQLESNGGKTNHLKFDNFMESLELMKIKEFSPYKHFADVNFEHNFVTLSVDIDDGYLLITSMEELATAINHQIEVHKTKATVTHSFKLARDIYMDNYDKLKPEAFEKYQLPVKVYGNDEIAAMIDEIGTDADDITDVTDDEADEAKSFEEFSKEDAHRPDSDFYASEDTDDEVDEHTDEEPQIQITAERYTELMRDSAELRDVYGLIENLSADINELKNELASKEDVLDIKRLLINTIIPALKSEGKIIDDVTDEIEVARKDVDKKAKTLVKAREIAFKLVDIGKYDLFEDDIYDLVHSYVPIKQLVKTLGGDMGKIDLNPNDWDGFVSFETPSDVEFEDRVINPDIAPLRLSNYETGPLTLDQFRDDIEPSTVAKGNTAIFTDKDNTVIHALGRNGLMDFDTYMKFMEEKPKTKYFIDTLKHINCTDVITPDMINYESTNIQLIRDDSGEGRHGYRYWITALSKRDSLLMNKMRIEVGKAYELGGTLADIAKDIKNAYLTIMTDDAIYCIKNNRITKIRDYDIEKHYEEVEELNTIIKEEVEKYRKDNKVENAERNRNDIIKEEEAKDEALRKEVLKAEEEKKAKETKEEVKKVDMKEVIEMSTSKDDDVTDDGLLKVTEDEATETFRKIFSMGELTEEEALLETSKQIFADEEPLFRKPTEEELEEYRELVKEAIESDPVAKAAMDSAKLEIQRRNKKAAYEAVKSKSDELTEENYPLRDENRTHIKAFEASDAGPEPIYMETPTGDYKTQVVGNPLSKSKPETEPAIVTPVVKPAPIVVETPNAKPVNFDGGPQEPPMEERVYNEDGTYFTKSGLAKMEEARALVEEMKNQQRKEYEFVQNEYVEDPASILIEGYDPREDELADCFVHPNDRVAASAKRKSEMMSLALTPELMMGDVDVKTAFKAFVPDNNLIGLNNRELDIIIDNNNDILDYLQDKGYNEALINKAKNEYLLCRLLHPGLILDATYGYIKTNTNLNYLFKGGHLPYTIAFGSSDSEIFFDPNTLIIDVPVHSYRMKLFGLEDLITIYNTVQSMDEYEAYGNNVIDTVTSKVLLDNNHRVTKTIMENDELKQKISNYLGLDIVNVIDITKALIQMKNERIG